MTALRCTEPGCVFIAHRHGFCLHHLRMYGGPHRCTVAEVEVVAVIEGRRVGRPKSGDRCFCGQNAMSRASARGFNCCKRAGCFGEPETIHENFVFSGL